MRKGQILTALGFIAFSIAVLFQARQVGWEWVEGQPQSGFFPFWLGLLLTLVTAGILCQTLLGSKDSAQKLFHDRTALVSVLKVGATGAGVLALTYLVGFYTAAILYFFVYTRFIGKHRWPAVIILSLAIPIGSYMLFERTLDILLPRGVYSILPFLD